MSKAKTYILQMTPFFTLNIEAISGAHIQEGAMSNFQSTATDEQYFNKMLHYKWSQCTQANKSYGECSRDCLLVMQHKLMEICVGRGGCAADRGGRRAENGGGGGGKGALSCSLHQESGSVHVTHLQSAVDVFE